MKRPYLQMGLLAVLLGVGGGSSPVLGAEDSTPRPNMERLERLEQRVNQMADRQEQLMRRLANAGDQRREERSIALRDDGPRPPMQPRPGLAAGEVGIPGQPKGIPPAGAQAPGHSKAIKDLCGLITLCFLVAIVFNILIAVWIFSDIRKRGEGSGIFIVLALLAGVPAAVIYALVRIGDRKL